MHWFIADYINEERALLSEAESHHAARVLRLKLGTDVTVIDGKGNGWRATISEMVGKHVSCLLKSPLASQRRPSLRLALAPTKQVDRTEWFAEKATEIGIREIYFFTSSNSERKTLRLDRLEKVVAAATKQSQRTHLPGVHGLMSFEDVVSLPYDRIIAWCGNDARPAVHIYNAFHKAASPLVIIGPEGDFSQDEINLAMAKNSQVVSLGEARLRTETAGIFACAAHQLLNV